MKKVIFYGASVTWQHKNHLGETTGYFPNCEALLQEKYGKSVEIHRFAHVGGHMNAAAWISLQDILHLVDEDTLFVSDWHTTSLERFPADALNNYYQMLMARKCRVLNLVMPMISSLGKDRYNIKQTRGMQNANFCLLNFYKLDFDFTKYIRDDVHTNAEGGRLYAGIIADAVQKMLDNDVIFDSGPTIPVPPTPAAPDIYSVAFERDILPGESLEFDFDDINTNSSVEIYTQIKKGPSSPTLHVTSGSTRTAVDIWDRWSYYEPKWSTFTALTGKLALEPGSRRVEIAVSEAPPDYAALSKEDPKALEAMEKIATPDLRLRVREKLYFVGARPTAVRVNGEQLAIAA